MTLAIYEDLGAARTRGRADFRAKRPLENNPYDQLNQNELWRAYAEGWREAELQAEGARQ